MRALRHRIANLFYAAGKRFDCAVPYSYDQTQFGDQRVWDDSTTHGSFNLHAGDGTPVHGSFSPSPSYMYTALHIGKGAEITIFPSRRTTRKLLTVLAQIEAGFVKYGEGDR